MGLLMALGPHLELATYKGLERSQVEVSLVVVIATPN
jgi:hypothetical protein